MECRQRIVLRAKYYNEYYICGDFIYFCILRAILCISYLHISHRYIKIRSLIVSNKLYQLQAPLKYFQSKITNESIIPFFKITIFKITSYVIFIQKSILRMLIRLKGEESKSRIEVRMSEDIEDKSRESISDVCFVFGTCS